MPKNTLPRSRRAAAPKKTKTKTKPTAASRQKIGGPYAQTLEQSLSHIRLNIQATIPGMLDTDELFRSLIIGYLLEHYRGDVLTAVAAGVQKVGRAHA
jgi:hypothetical protein